MNLKFQEVRWTEESELMYVVFRTDGQTMRWYPKWDDLRQLVLSAIIAEGCPHNWQGSELDKFKTKFQEMIDLIDIQRSSYEASYS